MKMKTSIATVAVATTFVASALSIPASAGNFRLGTPGYAGTGCPAGSVATTLSPDGKTLSVLFDSYEVEVGGPGNRNSGRKKCDLSIPVHVPSGWSFSLVDADYRGYIDLPRGAKASLRRDYFFAGRTGPALTKNWRGKIEQDYLLRDRLGLFANVWSGCGADVNLRAKTSLKVKTSANQEASAGVDSVDFQKKWGFKYRLRWKTCK